MNHDVLDNLAADNILRLAKSDFELRELAGIMVASPLRTYPVRWSCTPPFPKYRATMDYIILSSRILATSSAE
jgi:hypothetical protein